MQQDQFLTVIDRDEAERRFHAALALRPLGTETVPLDQAWGRIVAEDIASAVDVPAFDRSNVDGFAVRASDTFGASETAPRTLRLGPEICATGVVPSGTVADGHALTIATGGMLPRGADAVVMVEHTDTNGDSLLVRRAVAAGANIAYTGTDISAGELVIPAGRLLTSRETGVLAAIGRGEVAVFRRPWVTILSTGDELIAPGTPPRPASVYDSNARILADAVRELGCEPVVAGIVPDDLVALRNHVTAAIATSDVVLLSGGTSKGAGDVSYRVLAEFHDPGIVAHGVALKPGKPICLAVTQGKPVVVLPGFPTSAVFTFHEFVAPVLRRLAGLAESPRGRLPANLAMKVNSEIGRTEYLLVNLVRAVDDAPVVGTLRVPSESTQSSDGTRSVPTTLAAQWLAYPMGKGSGSVTAFSRADGFVTIDRFQEQVPAGTTVNVQLLAADWQPAELVVIGSHCLGLDYLLSLLERRGVRTKFLAVGSLAGLEAAKRGECDLAGIHLLDPASGEYNRPFLVRTLELIPGYGRLQGIVFRPGDKRFAGRNVPQAVAAAVGDPHCQLVNRNAGSGTRLLIDQLLAGERPSGYAFQTRNHAAVAAAVAQGRADWGVCIRPAAERAGLGFLPLAHEQYDFVTPKSRQHSAAVRMFVQVLAEVETQAALREMGMRIA